MSTNSCFSRIALTALYFGATALTPPVGAAEAPSPGKEALILEQGAVARQQLVAVGRDLTLAGEALADVAVISGAAQVSGSIAGDLIVLSGDARLAPTARVDGDVFALGGRVIAEPGARIGGRTASYPTFSAAWLTLLEGPSLGLEASSPLVLGGKLGVLQGSKTYILQNPDGQIELTHSVSAGLDYDYSCR